MPYTSLKSDYINELFKYPVRFDRSLVFFKESYKGTYFSYLAYISDHIELANKVSFIIFHTPCIVYCHSNFRNPYSFYSHEDLELFKSQLKILYHLFKSAIIQAKLYSLNKDF